MTTRRRFGSVRKLTSGRFQASYVDPRNGRRIPGPKTFATKKGANDWLIDMESALNRHELPDLTLGRLTYKEWSDKWIKTIHVRVGTIRSYKGILRNHVQSHFGAMRLNTIARNDIREFVAELVNSGMPSGTVTNIRQVLSMSLTEAVRSGAIKANPASGVKVRRSRRKEMAFLTRAQVALLAHAIEFPKIKKHGGEHRRKSYPEYGLLVRFVSETGLRSGEVAALRIGRLDLANGRVEVAESVAEVSKEYSPNGLIYDEPKTYERRSVPIPAGLVAELKEHIKTRPTDPDAFVFMAPKGGALRHQNFYDRQFRPAVKACADDEGNRLIPEKTRFHDLRHTYAALLIAAGANPLTVKQRMGHSSITVTMDRYGHLFPHLEEGITDKMDEAYRTAHQRAAK